MPAPGEVYIPSLSYFILQILLKSFQTGISVSNTPGAVDACTANTAIYLLLGALRRMHIPTQAIRAGQWRGSMSLGYDPDGKTLGILGMGGIGTAVARRALAFDFKLQYHNRHLLSPDQNPYDVPHVDFETLLKTSDAISVHLPLGDGTRGIIGRKEFAMMKDGVVIVNTARGPIIDEQALVEALQSGKVFAAGLDVYEKEPEVHEGLIASDRCILLPHVGTATYETQVRFLCISFDRKTLPNQSSYSPKSYSFFSREHLNISLPRNKRFLPTLQKNSQADYGGDVACIV